MLDGPRHNRALALSPGVLDRGLGASTSSTIHEKQHAGRLVLDLRQLCRRADNPATTANTAVASTAPGQAQAPERTSRIGRRTPPAWAGRPTGAEPGLAGDRRTGAGWPTRAEPGFAGEHRYGAGPADPGRVRIRQRTPLVAGSIGLQLSRSIRLPTPHTDRNSPVRQPPRQTPRTTDSEPGGNNPEAEQND